MWTLAPGLVVASQEAWGELRSLATGERWDLRLEDLPIVRALAVGIPETEAEQHRELAAAVKRGWAVQASSTDDEQVLRRLEQLERHFAWCRAAMPAAAHAPIFRAQAARRHLNRGLGQRVALPETLARRAALLGPEPQRVIIFADTDFLSLGVAAAGHEVTVLDDLREPFPAQLVGAFDAFFADPLSSAGALRLALARGLAALKPSGRGFICFSEAGAESFTVAAQDLGAATNDRYSDFNHYYGTDYQLSFYTSDLAIVRPRETLTLRPRPDEPYLPKSLAAEDLFLETPASRYAFKKINPETSHIAHLDAAMRILESIDRLQVLTRSIYEDGGVRSYLVHTKQGSVVFVRLVPELRVGELFVAPADSALEDAILAVLFGALGIDGTVVQKRRVRGSSVYTMT